jgi:hypothetical protein
LARATLRTRTRPAPAPPRKLRGVSPLSVRKMPTYSTVRLEGIRKRGLGS